MEEKARRNGGRQQAEWGKGEREEAGLLGSKAEPQSKETPSGRKGILGP